MKLKIAMAACLLGLVAGPSLADEEATREIDLPARSATVLTDENANGQPEELVCRRMRQTNSLITRRVCYTRAEWGEMHEDSVEYLLGVERTMQHHRIDPSGR